MKKESCPFVLIATKLCVHDMKKAGQAREADEKKFSTATPATTFTNLSQNCAKSRKQGQLSLLDHPTHCNTRKTPGFYATRRKNATSKSQVSERISSKFNNILKQLIFFQRKSSN
jgi:hypothetical protein